MRGVLIVLVGVVLACSKQTSTEVNRPEPPATGAEADEPAADEAEPTADATDKGDEPAAGHASCCDGDACEYAYYQSQKEWQAACEQGGRTMGNWCPETCSFMATADPPECGC